MQYIKEYSKLTKKFIESPDWDVIELKFTIDKELIKDYVNYLENNLSHLCFSFESNEYLRLKFMKNLKKIKK
jgi:hypothetical protein